MVKTVTANCGAEDKLGTVDQAIREKKIFTALVKMPEEVQMVLLENGWIGKKGIDDGNNPQSRGGGGVLSLHKNAERVKAVAKRYESGLLWTDARAGGVNWATLHPDVVVNRFPRDFSNATLRLCGHAMAGQFGFDDHFPRAYPADEVQRFVEDYSLTACVSMLRAFVDAGAVGGQGPRYAQNGQVPLSALHFAMNKCDQYVTDDGQMTNGSFAGAGPEWEEFFEQYYRIAHDGQKFAASAADAKLMCDLTALGKQLLGRLVGLRPQTAMDGCRNVWLVKSEQSANGRSCALNRIDCILKRLAGTSRAERVVLQKYVETPLLCDGKTFDVQTWLLISTLDGRLTVWSYRTCCVQLRSRKFSPDGTGEPKSAAHASAWTCGLKQLKGKLCSMLPAAKNDGVGGDAAVCAKVKRALESAASAAAGAEGVLNLRPNCFELFQATFVLGDDLHPWLIDIKSDPSPAHAFNHAASSVASAVARNAARVLVARDRASRTGIGRFEAIHKSAIPGLRYEPRPFAERPAARKKCDKPKLGAHSRRRDSGGEPHTATPDRWADGSVSTYIEKIRASEPDAGHRRPTRRAFAADGVEPRTGCRARPAEDRLCLVDLKQSMARLKTGSKINVYEAKHCLHLLDKWKTRVMSAQSFYKTVITKNNA